MPKLYYWLTSHFRAILIVLGIILVVASFWLPQGRIKRHSDHSTYETRTENLKLKKAISTNQKGNDGTKDFRQQLKAQQHKQDILLNVHTNPYNGDKAQKAQLVEDNKKVLQKSQKRLKKQKAVAEQQQLALNKQVAQKQAEQKRKQRLKAQKQRQIKATKQYIDSFFDIDGQVKPNFSATALKQAKKACKRIPKTDKEAYDYRNNDWNALNQQYLLVTAEE